MEKMIEEIEDNIIEFDKKLAIDVIKHRSSYQDIEANYNEKLKNEYFKKIADSLECSEEQKVLNTSKLFEVSKCLEQCSKCKSLKSCPFDIPGVHYNCKYEDNIIKFFYSSCKYKEKYDKDNEYIKRIYTYKMPSYIKDACFKDIKKDDANRKEALKEIKAFYDSYTKGLPSKGLYLQGNFGCGKTYLIAALFNELAKKGFPSTIIYFSEFLSELKNTFNKDDDSFSELFNKIKFSPLLLIDDIGAEKNTEWSRDEILCNILQYRMEENLPTFFTSNLSIELLESHLSCTSKKDDIIKARRIIERIKFLTKEIEMVSVNRRV